MGKLWQPMTLAEAQRLRERIQAASGPDRGLDRAIGEALGLPTRQGSSAKYGHAPQAFTRSLEQAMWLAGTVFPDMPYTISGNFGSEKPSAMLWGERRDYCGDGETVALSLLDGVFAALIKGEKPASGIEAAKPPEPKGLAEGKSPTLLNIEEGDAPPQPNPREGEDRDE